MQPHRPVSPPSLSCWPALCSGAAVLGCGCCLVWLALRGSHLHQRPCDLHRQPVRQRAHPGIHQPGPLPGCSPGHRYQHWWAPAAAGTQTGVCRWVWQINTPHHHLYCSLLLPSLTSFYLSPHQVPGCLQACWRCPTWYLPGPRKEEGEPLCVRGSTQQTPLLSGLQYFTSS